MSEGAEAPSEYMDNGSDPDAYLKAQFEKMDSNNEALKSQAEQIETKKAEIAAQALGPRAGFLGGAIGGPYFHEREAQKKAAATARRMRALEMAFAARKPCSLDRMGNYTDPEETSVTLARAADYLKWVEG